MCVLSHNRMILRSASATAARRSDAASSSAASVAGAAVDYGDGEKECDEGVSVDAAGPSAGPSAARRARPRRIIRSSRRARWSGAGPGEDSDSFEREPFLSSVDEQCVKLIGSVSAIQRLTDQMLRISSGHVVDSLADSRYSAAALDQLDTLRAEMCDRLSTLNEVIALMRAVK